MQVGLLPAGDTPGWQTWGSCSVATCPGETETAEPPQLSGLSASFPSDALGFFPSLLQVFWCQGTRAKARLPGLLPINHHGQNWEHWMPGSCGPPSGPSPSCSSSRFGQPQPRGEAVLMGCSRSRAFPRLAPAALCTPLSCGLGAQSLPRGWIERDGQAQTETRRQHPLLPSLKQLYPCNPKPPWHAAYPLERPAAGAGSGSEGSSLTGSTSRQQDRAGGGRGHPGKGTPLPAAAGPRGEDGEQPPLWVPRGPWRG